MTDTLERLHASAEGLLSRVDEILARCGAPEGHPIWALLRRRGLLPADAVANAIAWSPQILDGAAQVMRHHRPAWLHPTSDWEGVAAEAAEARIAAARRRHEVYQHNAQTLQACFADLADWLCDSRDRLARALARVLMSAQAVTIKTGADTETELAVAAADIGSTLLAEVDRLWTGAVDLTRDRCALLESFDVSGSSAIPAGGSLSVEL